MQVLHEMSACGLLRAALALCSCYRRTRPRMQNHPPSPSRSATGKDRKRKWTLFGSCQREVWEQRDSGRRWERSSPLPSMPLPSGRETSCCENRPPLNSGWKILMQAVPQKLTGLQASGHPPVVAGVVQSSVIKIVYHTKIEARDPMCLPLLSSASHLEVPERRSHY